MKSIVKIIKVWHHNSIDSGRKRLQEAAIGQFDELPSRKSVKSAILRGEILVNKEASKTSTWVSLGDELMLVINRVSNTNVKSTKSTNITVIFEDDYIAVVVKPGGVNTNGVAKSTLEKECHNILTKSTLPDAHESPKTAHRLDKATHGLVIIAKTISTSKALSHAFGEGGVKKEYTALVEGHLLLKNADINILIDGKRSRTLIQNNGVIKWPIHKEATYINIDLKTGRTHQARKHLSMVGHPVVGDEIYHSGVRFSGQGLFLACNKLTFLHPITNKLVSFSTKLPRKFKRVTSKLNMT